MGLLGQGDQSMSRQACLIIGDWTVDPSTGQATRGNQSVHLTPRAVDFLRVLAERPGDVVTPDELMDEVWADVVVAPDALYSVVAALRRCLGDDSHQPKYIETIPKRGYRLVAPVEHVEADRRSEVRSLTRIMWPNSRAAVGLAIMMAAIVATAALVRSHKVPDSSPVLSLAVVPSQSPDSDQNQHLRSLSDEIIKQLVVHRELQVETLGIPSYYGEDVAKHAAAGRSVGVDAVIIVRAADDGLIQVQLVDVESSNVRATYPVPLNDGATSDAAGVLLQQIANELDFDLEAKYSLSQNSMMAREQETLGRYYLQERFTPFTDPYETMQKSIAAFTAATEADPEYVEGWTGLALAWALNTAYESEEHQRQHCIERSREVIRRALALDADSAEAYAAMGLVYVFERNPVMARALFEQSLGVQPDNPMVLRWISRTMQSLGDFHLRAVYATRAAELAPYSRQFLADAANASALVRNFDETFYWMEAQLALNPADPDAINNLIVYRRDAGQLAEAINLGPRMASTLAYQHTSRHGWQFLPGMMANLFTQLDAPHLAEPLLRQAEADYPDDEYTHWARSSYLIATGDIQQARRHLLEWEAVGEITANLAVHAVLLGMNDYAAELLDHVPKHTSSGASANPNLVRGPWLNVDDLEMGSLMGTYVAYLEGASGNQLAKDAVLKEAMTFLDYWIHQGVATPWAYYHRAAVHAMQGRPAQGIVDLEAAIDAGFSVAWRLRNDPVLLNLHEQPEFSTLLQTVLDELASQRIRVDLAATQVEYEARYGLRIR